MSLHICEYLLMYRSLKIFHLDIDINTSISSFMIFAFSITHKKGGWFTFVKNPTQSYQELGGFSFCFVFSPENLKFSCLLNSPILGWACSFFFHFHSFSIPVLFPSGKPLKAKAGRGSCCPGLSHPALILLQLLATELIFPGSGWTLLSFC